MIATNRGVCMPQRPPARTRNSGDAPRVGDERGIQQEEEEAKSHCAVSQQQHVGEAGFCSVWSSRGRIKKGGPNKDLQALVWSFQPVSRGLSRQRNRRWNSREMAKALGIRTPLGITSLHLTPWQNHQFSPPLGELMARKGCKLLLSHGQTKSRREDGTERSTLMI
ncbi:hypothetical protein MUK42_07160 [Musa troglodytarum]|uniref:Uncharacterized protein n=1 Tax=Musa troglodytarum TaxID=320322 RepID=A0A9E7KME2_9LILI|nr:hypothetical protein MUK42_07160 [Musa troglodytarum]